MEEPSNAADITPEWLGALMHGLGLISAPADVTGITVERLGDGVGFTSDIQRIGIGYNRRIEGAPASLVAKSPSSNPALAPATKERILAACRKEAQFYSHLANQCAVRTLRVFFAGVESGLLVLEDGNELLPGDQVLGCPYDRALSALDSLAALHAQWWHDPRSSSHEWIGRRIPDWLDSGAQARYRSLWERQLQGEGEELSPARRQIGDLLVTDFHKVQPRLAVPVTLVHGDYRVDNLLFPPGAGDPPVVIDWPAVALCNPGVDTGYFLSGSVNSTDRSASIEQLSRHYWDNLREHGVTGYSLDECLLDCRLGVLDALYRHTIYYSVFDLTADRAQRLWRAIRSRHEAAIEELDLLGFLANLGET